MPLNVRNIDIRGLISYTEGAAPAPSVPVASFTATPISGTATLTVSFTDLSTNTPTSWLWDFKNDGTATSTQQNPSYEYTQAGTYSVKLSATNSAGTGVTTSTNLITVSSPVVIPNQYTTLQLPGTGTNNANNNTFLDSSSNNFTVTRVGNTTQGTFTPYSDAAGYWSNYFDGTGDYLSVADATAFDLPNDFTIEMWIYPVSTAGSIISIGNYQAGNNGLSLYFSSNKLRLFVNASDVLLGASNLVANTWTHVALVRSGSGSNNLKLYLNGVQDAQATNTTSYTGVAANGVSVAADYGGVFSSFFNGYTSNVRIVKGTAVYTSNFTPSTTPLTAVSETSLLTCNNNRFMDDSSNNFTVTRVGDTRVQSFGPFTPARAYSTSVVGGSMYFDGTGDYLTLPNSAAALALGSNDFTLEAWVYPTTTAECTIFYINGNSNSYAAIRLATLNGNLTLLASSAGSDWNYLPTLSGVRTNAWNHVAVSRSGTSLRLFLNGTASASTSISGSLMAGAFNWIGRINHAANYYFTGYISDARIIVGNAIYTGNYVVPTAPLTAVSGTSLLLSGTNAGIYDASMSTIVETVGDAKISTTISASGSMYFDGTGDYLTVANNAALNMVGGDFTIECWFYPTATPSASGHTLFAKRASTAAFTQIQLLFVSNLTPQLYASTNGSSWGISNPAASVPCLLNAWNHVAVTRSGNNFTLFINGQVSATATLSGSLMSNSDAFSIGAGAANGGSPMIASYISNFRVVKGTAVYTANFTPPTRS